MATAPAERTKVTVPDLARMKRRGDKITMITAYDATFARLVDDGGVDMILVGDSVGMVVQGEANTIPVDLDEMAYHVRLVARAKPKAIVVGDLPFGSYQVTPQQAVESSIRLMKEGAECVKLEGGVTMADTIAAIARVDIPVMGHIGLTPQSYHRMGGHKVQGREAGFEAGGRERLLDGQVLVLHDVVGLSDLSLKFTKKYANLRELAIQATRDYVAEVRSGEWPDDAHSFH
jgi:3-methyl-2-oxobutanoate hydroxymethyltransferase